MAMPTHEMDADSSGISSPQNNMADSRPLLEQMFSKYPILTGIMQYLHFYDYRNLRLAGCRVPVTSTAVQKKHLIPIHCNDFRDNFDNTTRCGKSPHDVEMKPCEGISLASSPDDPILDFQSAPLRHLHDGRDKSKCFWVCQECRDRSQAHYENHTFFLTPTLAQLCETHSLEYEGNTSSCRCCRTAIGDWRCSMCIETGIDMLALRAQNAHEAMPLHVTFLGTWSIVVRPQMIWTAWMLWELQQAQDVFNTFTRSIFLTVGLRPRAPQMLKWGVVCPIENCTRAAGEGIRGLRQCLECKAICRGY